MNNHHQNLLNIFQIALKAVAGDTVVAKELASTVYPDSFHVIAIGKAADAMFQGVPAEKVKTALIISKHGHISKATQADSRLICIESDHPVPQENSINAGRALLSFLEALPKDEPCLFLISGGASALVEVLQDDWTLAQLQALTDYLLANAYSIHDINAIRRRLSKIKGGGLWTAIGDRAVHCLMISDVADDDPAIIGSGLLFPSDEKALPNLPAEWAGKINPFKAQRAAGNFHWKIVACLNDAKEAAAKAAQGLGYQTKIYPNFIEGNALDVAADCVSHLQSEPNSLFIWGGETTVNLPNDAGKGGRNQHLALAAAIQMEGAEDTYLLAAGTDGTDGLSTATGALVDGETLANGLKQGLDARDFLLRADSNTFFQAAGGLIETGATGTNVMDLMIGISTG